VIIASGWRTSDLYELIAIVILLAASGLLATAETSLVRTSRIKAISLADQHRRGAKKLLGLVEHPERFLNPILLMVLICQLVSATLIGVLASAWLGALGVLVGTVFEVVVVFVFFEAVPKNWAMHNTDRAALLSAPLVSTLVRFPPIRAVSFVLIRFADLIGGGRKGAAAPAVTESELLAMADVAHAESVIEFQERDYIHSLIEFGDTVVREVMVPRPEMVLLGADETVREALRHALKAGRSRLPVCEEDVDDVVGIAYVKDLVRAEHDGEEDSPLRTHLRDAHFVPETKRLASLLKEMQDKKFHLSMVVDEYGSTVGLVTLEDLIEELVGEIVDEYDNEEPPIETTSEGTLIVAGRMAVDDAEDALSLPLPKGAWDTVGGLLLALLGHVPVEGEEVDTDHCTLRAERVQGRRILRVRLSARNSVEAG
jgi:CBS domain containing-hemolysin-like protein